MLLFKKAFWENADPQTLKENDFSPVWVRKCFCKFQLMEKAESQTLQENSFSPVCVCMWLFKVELKENADPQTAQENGFPLVYVSMYFLKGDLSENTVSETSQDDFSLVGLPYIFFIYILSIILIHRLQQIMVSLKCVSISVFTHEKLKYSSAQRRI